MDKDKDSDCDDACLQEATRFPLCHTWSLSSSPAEQEGVDRAEESPFLDPLTELACHCRHLEVTPPQVVGNPLPIPPLA